MFSMNFLFHNSGFMCKCQKCKFALATGGENCPNSPASERVKPHKALETDFYTVKKYILKLTKVIIRRSNDFSAKI